MGGKSHALLPDVPLSIWSVGLIYPAALCFRCRETATCWLAGVHAAGVLLPCSIVWLAEGSVAAEHPVSLYSVSRYFALRNSAWWQSRFACGACPPGWRCPAQKAPCPVDVAPVSKIPSPSPVIECTPGNPRIPEGESHLEDVSSFGFLSEKVNVKPTVVSRRRKLRL